LLLQPIISVSPTMDGVSEAQQQGFQVLRGSSFTISCSVQPQYPGGSFQLTFTSSNTTYNYTQPAVNHSADFLFPAADPAHQGHYSCVYGVYVFSHNFSSENSLFSLTVTDPAHQGNYSCVYGVYVFSHNFSSESRLLSLTVTGPDENPPDKTPYRTGSIIAPVVLLVALLLGVIIIFFILKASRGQRSGPQENTELSYYNPSFSREPAEEEGAQGAE
ncbi:scavenger receptor cysteine-rich type 1 protein M130-like, partial [Scomber scombrus]